MTARVPGTIIERTLQRWARLTLQSGGSLSASSYDHWARNQEKPTVTRTTIRNRETDPSWAHIIVARRQVFLELANSWDVTIEAPVWREDRSRLCWAWQTVERWASATICDCQACKPRSHRLGVPAAVTEPRAGPAERRRRGTLLTPTTTAEAAVRAWALASISLGGSLAPASYDAWASSQVPKPPTGTTIRIRLGARSWADLVLDRRAQLVEHGDRHRDVEVEVPVRCIGDGRVRWHRRTISAWERSALCACAHCAAPPIGEAHPDLLDRLENSSDACRSVDATVAWKCSNAIAGHPATKGTARAAAADAIACSSCRAREVFHRRHRPGELVAPDRAVQRVETTTAVAAHHLLPPGSSGNTLVGWRIALEPHDELMAVTPLFVLAEERLAVLNHTDAVSFATRLSHLGWHTITAPLDDDRTE